MVNVSKLSCPALKTECDIFAVNPVQNSVTESVVSIHRPISILADSGPIEVVIPGTNDYFDLSNTILYLSFKLVKTNGEKLTNNDIATVVNLPGHSLFEKISVSFNNKIVSNSTNYAYKAYIESILNYSAEAKNGHLQSQIFFKDTSGHFDDIATEKEASKNTGFTSRVKITNNSNEVEIITPLHIDVFNQPKYLIDNIDVSVKFYPQTSPEFYSLARTPCKISISDIYLMVRKVKINPLIVESHAKVLQQVSAKFPINRTEIKTVTIAAGVNEKNIDNLYIGTLPNRVIFGLVKSKSYNGDYSLNPYNFQHYNVSEIGVYFDNQPVAGHPLKFDYKLGKYALAYHSLMQGTGRHFSDAGISISHSEYKDGYCLYVFDLTVDQSSSSNYWSLEKAGCMGIHLKFNKELKENVTAIIYTEFDNVIEIDNFRNVLIDYSC
jgi:hypothetical protein